MQRPDFLDYRNHRFLKWGALLVAAAILAYLGAPAPGNGNYGGTWLGYLLGIVCATIVAILAWYGIRKRRPPIVRERRTDERRRMVAHTRSFDRRVGERRRPASRDSLHHGNSLQGWLSAHVYLGLALPVIALLHSGFRLGWNLHSLPLVLLFLTAISGLYGVVAYLRYPRLISENIGAGTRGGLIRKIDELDALALEHAQALPDDVSALVMREQRDAPFSGGLLEQLGVRPAPCPTERALRRLKELSRTHVQGNQVGAMRELYSMLLEKQLLVEKARIDMCLNARMQAWLYLHVPLTFALLAAILSHVLLILVFW